MGRGEPTQKSDFWTRVAELERTAGIPRSLAQQVVSGQLSLNGAIEKLALRDRVEALMRKHDMSRALATQIAIGHADLEVVLRRARMRAHKEAHYAESILDAAAADGRELGLGLHGRRTVRGAIASIDRYELDLRTEAGEERLHKLAIKFAFDPAQAKRVRRATRYDKARRAAPSEPIVRPQDRYTCSDRRLFGYIDAGVQVKVVTLEGELFRGRITTLRRYEFVLELKGGVALTVFRHALAELAENS